MLSTDIMRYVELHRAVGFRFHTQHQLLSSFAAFADTHGDEFVRVERALDWASRSSSLPQRRRRLLEVRRFALAMRPEDARHEVPAADALGRASYRRRIAHIYMYRRAIMYGPTRDQVPFPTHIS